MLNELHQKYPWKSINKFMPYALKKGFSEGDVKKYFRDYVLKDKLKINLSQYYLPIYGKSKGCYQFDTLIQSRGLPKGFSARGDAMPPSFLVFININSRKAYAYPMTNKGKEEVLRVMKMFIDSNRPTTLTSDQDSAYINRDMINLMLENNIDYRTTEDNNHNILGIINRLMKTLRDLNKTRDFTVDSMNKVINLYNDTTHSSTGKPPNSFTDEDEEEYISKMRTLTESITSQDSFTLMKGDKVRIVLDKPVIGKKRSNLSPECYIVDSVNGNSYNIVAKDNSVATYPRHKLVVTSKGRIAETLDSDKRGIISEIISYNPKTDKYKVIYEGGVKDEIKAKNLRETNPTSLSRMEIEFWKNKDAPPTISKYKGLY
jgi:hypothetical protein